MRTILLACALCADAAAPVFAQSAPPEAPLGRMQGAQAVGISGIIVPTAPRIADEEVVGLAPGSRLDLLTWERVYALALVRIRDGRGDLAEALDTKILDEQAARLGVADFDRFRKEFLAARHGAGGTFRDPSVDYLDLLRRLQMIDNSYWDVGYYENLLKLIAELNQGPSTGLTPLDADRVSAALLRARQGLSEEVGQFRVRLDKVKVALGLSPHAPVIPDRRSLAMFRTMSEAVDNWLKDPDRDVNDMRKLTHNLPTLGKVMVDGYPILGAFEGDPGPGEDVLANAVQIAIEHRLGPDKGQSAGVAAAQLELRVRRHLRHLFQTRRAYQTEKRNYEFAIRLRDQSFERMVSPSTANGSGGSGPLGRLLQQDTRQREAVDRLVTLATSFRAERLALYRELGVMPYTDWASFNKDLATE